ncbi:MAG: N-acyl-D-amino-acid deacylase family protein [Bacillota bacterium]|jgi:N-acyl-D-amino-acid deacylase
MDLVIMNALVVDGTGNPGFRGSVGVKGDKIAYVGALTPKAKKVIDARGAVVCPGFVDPHNHEELSLFRDGLLERYLRQGVTTGIDGNCGSSIMTTSKLTKKVQSVLGNPPPEASWNSLEEYKEAAESQGLGFNHGVMMGHGTMRWHAMGGAFRRQASPDELDKMKRFLEEGLSQGAIGMSTGLDYVPGRASDTAEIVELAKILAKYDRTYASHVRNAVSFDRGDGVAEALSIGRQSGARVHVSHLRPADKASVTWIEEARKRGVEAACDVMPQSGGHVHRIDAFTEETKNAFFEYYDMPVSEFRKVLLTPEGRKRVKENGQIASDKDEIILVHCKEEWWEGRSVSSVAGRLGVDPTDFVLDLMASEDIVTSIWMYCNRRNKSSIQRHPVYREVMSSPVVTCGSDSIMVDPKNPLIHYELQRNGVFPAFLEMAGGLGSSLEYNIMRCTSLPARMFRLSDRGLLAQGMAADLIIFDPLEFHFPEEIDPRDPGVVAKGVSHVVVNGKLVIEDFKLTSERPGRVLLK